MSPGLTILNIDDSAAVRSRRTQWLRQFGLEVREACEAEGLETALKHTPDLIVLTRRSPGSTGLSGTFAAHPATAAAPVLSVDPDEPPESLLDRIQSLLGTGPDGAQAPSNRQRVIADAVGADVMFELASDYLDLLEASTSVFETNGDYALGICNSGWCRLLGEAVVDGKRPCQEEDWRVSRLSMESRQPVEMECTGGIRLYALPVMSGSEVVGSVSFGYGDPPREEAELAAIAARYNIPVADLRAEAARYTPPPPEVIALARRRLKTAARMIGALVEHQRTEDRLRRLQDVTVALARAGTTAEVLDAVVEHVAQAAGALAGAVALLEPGGLELRTVRAAGYTPEAVQALHSISADAALPLAEAARFRDVVLVAAPETVAAVPLIVNDSVIGAVEFRFAARVLNAEEGGFLMTLGQQCAQALERARLYDAEVRLLTHLSEENRRLEDLFSALPGCFATYSGPDHIAEFSNAENTRLWGGRSPVGKTLRQAYPELGERLFALWDQVYRAGKPVRLTETPVQIDVGRGRMEERFFDISLVPRRDSDGVIAGVLAFAFEVTEKVRSRRVIEHQRAFWEAVLNQMPMGVALAEAPSGHVVFLNEEARRLLGESLPPDAARQLFTEAAKQKDVAWHRPDGAAVQLSLHSAPIRDSEGRSIAEVRAFHDITERRLAQETLRRQAQLINLSQDAIIIANPHRVITGWNEGAEEMYGWKAAGVLGRITHDVLQTRAPVSTAEIDAALNREGRWHGELFHMHADGRQLITDSRQVLVRDEQGRPAAILEINRDVTRRKRDEQALRESEEWLKFTQQAAGVGIFDWDVRRDIMKWSDELCRIHGLDPRPDPFRWDEWDALIHAEDRPHVRAKMNAALAEGGTCDLEYRVVWPDGSVRWVSAKATVFFDDQARPARIIGANLDVTDRKRSEEAHQSAQKLESIGLLAGGIAHDFNNLLTSIMGNASLVLDEVPPETREKVESIVSGAGRAADLTRQLLAYAGKGRFVPRELSLSGLVREMADLVRVSIPKTIDVRLEAEDDVPAIRADAGQIQQVIMNLLINAAEAIGDSATGLVTVRTGVEVADGPFGDALHGGVPEGAYAYLEVSDTGCGMDEATRARIFDPFFTTKFIGRGLGLAAVSGIVRSHKGAIRIDSSPGGGSTFRVLFPALGGYRPAAPPAKVAEKDLRGSGTVLVVDDEDYVRDFLRDSLERHGYRVLLASNGREALETLAARGDVSLVLLDLIMPEFSGGEAFAEIKRRWPTLPVLVTSGYDQSEAERLCPYHDIDGFIQKPYTTKHLMAKVKAVLETR